VNIFLCLVHAVDVSDASKSDSYQLYDNICTMPTNIGHQRVLNDVPRAVCRAVCSGAHSDYCSGFLYSRHDRSCTLSPFTGEPVGRLQCDRAQTTSTGLEFYRRFRKLGNNIVLVVVVVETIGIAPVAGIESECWH
jgi:hypothetical protein